VLRVGPYLLDFSSGHGRLYPGNEVDSNGGGNDHGCNDPGQDHMAGAFGKFLAKGGIVGFFLRILMK
jgi:hypothetical protein